MGPTMSDLIAVPYVRTVLAEQDTFRDAPPSAFPRAIRSIAKPVSFFTSRLIPGDVVEAAIRGADWAASGSIRTAAISHDFSDLEACDAAGAMLLFDEVITGFRLCRGGAAECSRGHARCIGSAWCSGAVQWDGTAQICHSRCREQWYDVLCSRIGTRRRA